MQHSCDMEKPSKLSWIAYVLIFLFPFNIYHFDLPMEINLNAFQAFVILFSILSLILYFNKNFFIRNSAISQLLALYLLSGALSFIMVENMIPAIRGFFTHVVLLMSFTLVLSCVKNRYDIENAITVFIAVGIVASVMALTQFFGFVFFDKYIFPPFTNFSDLSRDEIIQQGQFGFAGGLMRPSAFFGSKNQLGSYLLIPFGFSLFRLIHHNRFKIMYLATTVILFLSILISMARTGWIGLIIFFCALFLLKQIDKPSFILRIFLILFLSLIMIVFLKYSTEIIPDVEVIQRMNPFNPDNQEGGSKTIFIEHFWAALRANVESFGLGVGFQNFDDWAYDKGIVEVWGSHSSFIIFLGETGLLGLLSHVLIVIVAIRYGLKDYLFMKRGKFSPRYDKLSIFIISIYFGLIFAGITRTYYYVESTFLMVALLLRLVHLNRVEYTANSVRGL